MLHSKIGTHLQLFYILSNHCNEGWCIPRRSAARRRPPLTTFLSDRQQPTDCCRLAVRGTVQPTASREVGYGRPFPVDEPPQRYFWWRSGEPPGRQDCAWAGSCDSMLLIKFNWTVRIAVHAKVTFTVLERVFNLPVWTCCRTSFGQLCGGAGGRRPSDNCSSLHVLVQALCSVQRLSGCLWERYRRLRTVLTEISLRHCSGFFDIGKRTLPQGSRRVRLWTQPRT